MVHASPPEGLPQSAHRRPASDAQPDARSRLLRFGVGCICGGSFLEPCVWSVWSDAKEKRPS